MIPLSKQAFGKSIRVVHEAVEILERAAGLAEVPVRDGLDVRGPNVFVSGAGVVDPHLVAAQSAEHLMYGLPADLAEEIPQGDVDRRCGPVLGSGGRLRHRQVHHVAVNGLDVQRVAPQEASGKGVMDVGLDRTGAVKRFAETDDPAVGVNADPEDVRKLLGSQGLDGGDFHLLSLSTRDFVLHPRFDAGMTRLHLGGSQYRRRSSTPALTHLRGGGP